MRSSLCVSVSVAVCASALTVAYAAPATQPVPAGTAPVAPAPAAKAAVAPAAKPGAAAKPGPAWKPYLPQDGSFRALLPGVPTMSVQRDGISDDRPMEHLYLLTDGAASYVVEYTDDLDAALQAFGPQRVLTSFDWGFFREASGKVTDAKPINVGGVPGREAHLITGNGRSVTYRSCIIGGRFYHWGTSVAINKDAAADTEKFLASFVPGRPQSGAAVSPSGSAATSSVEKPAPKPAAPKSTPWREVRVGEGGFSVLTPEQKPDTATVQILPAARGAKAPHKKKEPVRKLNFTDEAESYSVSWNAPGARDGDDLWTLRERTAASLRGKVLSYAPIEIAGCAGEEFHVQLPDDLSAVVRLLRSGDRVYTLTAITPMERSYSDATLRFLNSFKLLKK